MHVPKAVITAGRPDQRQLPLQRVVDVDGREKFALQVMIEEVLEAGIEEIALVITPGDEATYRQAAGSYSGRLCFIEQTNPRGYGDAVLRAADFVNRDAFLHLVSDHLWLSRHPESRCAHQLIARATQEGCAVSAVQAGRERVLPFYGVVGARPVPGCPQVFEVERVIEKPSPTDAEILLNVPGLRAGWYLCLFGMHVLTPTVMHLLRESADAIGTANEQAITLTPVLSSLCQHERHLALEVAGTRFNIGERYGLFFAQAGFALAGEDRDELLVRLIDMLAEARSMANTPYHAHDPHADTAPSHAASASKHAADSPTAPRRPDRP